MTTTIDTAALMKRHRKGEKITALAREVGMTWQKLHGVLYPSRPKTEPERRAAFTTIETDPAPKGVFGQSIYDPLTGRQPGLMVEGLAVERQARRQQLTEKYRPRRIADLLGQPDVQQHLSDIVQDPCSTSFVFAGGTGTGKTSAALALAIELGCLPEHEEMGGVHQIASGEQSADAVRDLLSRLHFTPMCGSGWKVCIVNEADRMHLQAETIWLDALENLPPRTVVVFTTNHLRKMATRFRDRCELIEFESDSDRLKPSVRELVIRIFREETGTTLAADHPYVAEVVEAALDENGEASLRRAVQQLSCLLRRLPKVGAA